MRKLLIALSLLLLISCQLASYDKHYVVVRNQTDETMEIGIWLADAYYDIKPGEEHELKCVDRVKILTPYGVAYEDVDCDNTMELHTDGYYWGEEFKHYWTER